MKAKILLLEDDITLSDTVVDFLEDKGFEVVCAYDGEEASMLSMSKTLTFFCLM